MFIIPLVVLGWRIPISFLSTCLH